ncbi:MULTISPECIES: hypothetical protein [Streptomyces]|uniref:Tail assembly chaperone n=2 Tax=Streptomyces TaxID=1883 RepID=A0ABV9IS94_9ACTN
MTAENTPARKTTSRKPSAPKAAKAEALNEEISFEHAGIEFTFPADPKKLPLTLLMTDDEIEATRIVLGERQFTEYLATNPTIEDFGILVDKMSEARGREAGSGN